MTKLAVYLDCSADSGGAFQYARECLEAVRALSVQCWHVRVYYHAPEWDLVLQRMNLQGVHLRRLSGYKRYVAALISRVCCFMPKSLRLYCMRYTFPSWTILEYLPDIVFTPGQASIGVPASTRQIAAIHDLMHIYEPSFPEVGSSEERTFRTRLYNNIVQSCSDILVDSPLGKQQLLDNFPARSEQIHVVPFVPPTELLAVAPVKPKEWLPDDFFFYPAQFWQHKNHCTLLDALKAVKQSLPQVHCVLTGATKYNGYANVLKRIADNELQENVTILGYVDDAILVWLYRNARFMIYPSFFGPTNIPPLEAMLLHCPVAVSSRYAMPWQCGDAALYFNPSDVYSLSSAVERLWSDASLRLDLQSKGKEKVKEWTQKEFQQRILQVVQQKDAVT